MVDTDRVIGGAKELGGKVQSAVGDAVGASKEQIEGRYREAEGRVQQAYGQAKDKARDVADDVGDYVGDAYERGSDYARDAYDRGGTYVRDGQRAVASRVEENPMVALLIAGAVGYGLALLLHSGNNRR